MKTRAFHRSAIAATVLVAALSTRAQVVVRVPQPLHARVLAPAGAIATVVPEDLAAVEHELDAATRSDVAAFRADAGPDWRFFVDRRSGGMALVEGRGVPWLPADADAPSAEDLGRRALAFVARYPALFQVPGEQLRLDPAATTSFGEQGQYWNVVLRQVVDGVPVAGARVVFRLAWGNLVQFGVDRTLRVPFAVAERTPLVSRDQARAALAVQIGGLSAGDRFVDDGSLTWVPYGADERGAYRGPIGQGWRPMLAYRFAFTRGAASAWRGLVDARTGRVVRFVDDRDYAKALLKGSVYPFANCADPMSCTPGDTDEVAVTMPYAQLTFTGATCTGAACFTNAAGAFDYPAGATSAATALLGKYFQVADQCGAVNASASAPANVDLGTAPADAFGFNTDCWATNQASPPGTDPVDGGPGDTHSARNCYYHLNLIGEKARTYLPANDWLKGADGTRGPVTINTNLPAECNAYWSGGAGTLNFEQVTLMYGCNNTGEVPDIFLHEFGHGLDQNDATGTAPEGGTGEAMGDTFALLQGQHSCIGPGFRTGGGFGGNTAGYGTTSYLCSGVRDIDYTKFCWPSFAGDCNTTPDDPDAPNGSRSGTTPPPNPPDAGTPARWNTMIETAPAGVADGQSNFYNCSGPEDSGCAGPLDHGCHCESQIASQANWDLAKRIITQQFGGNIYANPQGPREVSGWQTMDRLWYLTRDLALSAYSATGPAPDGTTNGCGVDNWYATYRFIDDNDGNLANGTPHAAAIFAAFDLHGMACGAAGDATNQSTGCTTTPPAPVLSTCSESAPVALTWTASAGAKQYRVLRNTIGCGYGFTPLATLDGRQFHEDPDVAPGLTYFYSVQPVGDNPSCLGQVSNCIAVTPTACPAPTLAKPTGVVLSTPAPNQILVRWNVVAGAQSYKVLRRDGSCAVGGGYTPIATVQAPATSFLDTVDVQGTRSYSYEVAASGTTCGACASTPSDCASTVATGGCALAPAFPGLQTIDSGRSGSCHVSLTWAPGTPACGSTLTYAVYRSTDPSFTPANTNRIAAALVGTAFDDWTAGSGTRYYYVARAVDSFGNNDGNLLRMGEAPSGPLAAGTFSDDAGDTSGAKFRPSPTKGNLWSIRPNGTGDATNQYATTDGSAATYPPNLCEGLESDTIYLGANPSLSFRSRYDLENGYDGGYVEVSTEPGGYRDWTKLTTINYPGTMTDPGVAPACGGPGFADNEPVFTGTGDWATFSGSLAAYANRKVRLRFLFSSDPAASGEGWFLDDISVTGAQLPTACLPELSRADSGHLLRVRRNAGKLDLVFQDLGTAAKAYDVYEGTLGTWYSHASTRCHDTSSVPGSPAPGDRTLSNYTPAHAQAYILVNAVNATTEGVLAVNGNGGLVPLPSPACGPMP